MAGFSELEAGVFCIPLEFDDSWRITRMQITTECVCKESDDLVFFYRPINLVTSKKHRSYVFKLVVQ